MENADDWGKWRTSSKISIKEIHTKQKIATTVKSKSLQGEYEDRVKVEFIKYSI